MCSGNDRTSSARQEERKSWMLWSHSGRYCFLPWRRWSGIFLFCLILWHFNYQMWIYWWFAAWRPWNIKWCCCNSSKTKRKRCSALCYSRAWNWEACSRKNWLGEKMGPHAATLRTASNNSNCRCFIWFQNNFLVAWRINLPYWTW